MLPLGLIYAVGELLTLRSVQKAGMSLLSMSKDTEFKTEDGYGWIDYWYRIQNRGWIWMDRLLWLYWYILILLFLRLLVGSTASGRPFQGVGCVCQCTDLPASTKSMSPFLTGLWACLRGDCQHEASCFALASKLLDPGHKDLAKLCKLRWSPFALPFWLDQPWYLWHSVALIYWTDQPRLSLQSCLGSSLGSRVLCHGFTGWTATAPWNTVAWDVWHV